MSRMFTRQVPMVRPEDVTASPPLEVNRHGNNLDFRLNLPPELWARISGGNQANQMNAAYSWVEQMPQPGGSWKDRPDGMVGTQFVNPAYELNAIFDIPAGTIVRLMLSYFNPDGSGAEFTFNHCCFGGISSSSSSD